jgi:hypothetical protein
MQSALSPAAVDNMCALHAWPLALDLGQNRFSIRVTAPQQASTTDAARIISLAAHAAGAAATVLNSSSAAMPPSAAAGQPSAERGQEGGAWAAGNASEWYSLSVVRLADPEHAQMAQLNATTSARESVRVCGGEEGKGARPAACAPNARMWLNVSAGVDWVALHPGLRWAGAQGLRCEVNGQVLSAGGNVGADQVEDTQAVATARPRADFLPQALVLGLAPGVPLEVPIVVIAEDGVTSLRYFLSILRAQQPANSSSSSIPAAGGPASDGSSSGGDLDGSGEEGLPAAQGPSGAALQFVQGDGAAVPRETGWAELAADLPIAHEPLPPGNI